MEKLSKVDISEIRKAAVLGGDTDIIDLCDAYLALKEEVEQLESDVRHWRAVSNNHGSINDQLQAENRALKEEYMQAVEAEPELPGEIPAEILDHINAVGHEETMRIVVRATKYGILKRIAGL